MTVRAASFFFVKNRGIGLTRCRTAGLRGRGRRHREVAPSAWRGRGGAALRQPREPGEGLPGRSGRSWSRARAGAPRGRAALTAALLPGHPGGPRAAEGQGGLPLQPALSSALGAGRAWPGGVRWRAAVPGPSLGSAAPRNRSFNAEP